MDYYFAVGIANKYLCGALNINDPPLEYMTEAKFEEGAFLDAYFDCDAKKDPHLHLAHGGRADFRGRHGVFYNFFSAPGLAVNLKTEEATSTVRRPDGKTLVVEGSFITEAHLVALVGGEKRKWANASFWASELGENNWGWSTVNGSCGGRSFKLGKGAHKTCDDLSVTVKMARATFEIGAVTVEVVGGRTLAISGPEHRLDVSFTVRGDYARRYRPHGIFGQSFSSPVPRRGRQDIYPWEGHFRTSAMAEGAIEGDAAMYEVASPHATQFRFSRFDAEPLQARPPP